MRASNEGNSRGVGAWFVSQPRLESGGLDLGLVASSET